MAPQQTLDYDAAQTPSARYEWEMESARLRLLRRRFNAFCVVLGALSLVWLPAIVYRYYYADGWHAVATGTEIAHTVLYCSLLGFGWWYARRKLSDERYINRVATLLVVAAGLLGLVATRVSVEFQIWDAQVQAMMDQPPPARPAARPPAPVPALPPVPDMADAASPASRPATMPATREADDGAGGFIAGLRDNLRGVTGGAGDPEAAGQPPQLFVDATSSRIVRSRISVLSMAWVLFVTHFVACLFLPWRVREALRPAVILLVGAAALVGFDVLVVRTSLWSLPLAATVMPLALAPGVGWCWWRYSRFRKRYRFVLEGRELRELRQELDGAKRIHESSLPPIYADGPLRLSYVYEPMRQVGGDLIFVHPRPPTRPRNYDRPHDITPPPRHTMVLLDVTGHGIAAALTVNRLVGELERVFAENRDLQPAAVIRALNRYVYLTLATHGVFVTGLAVSVDPSRHDTCAASFCEPHAVTFCSAGHPTAFVRRAATGAIEPLESTAMMLGVLPPREFEAEQVDLTIDPGDAVVVYTDGATEARDPLRRKMLGIDGVRRLLERATAETSDPLAWPAAMIRRVGSYRNAPPEDDTLIAVIYRPPVPAQAREEPAEAQQPAA